MAQKTNRICEICTQAQGQDFCNECQQVFCRNCKILHMRTKSNRVHTFRNSDFLRREIDLPICELHNEEFMYFCEKCEDPTCKVCIFTTHRGHNMADISEVVAKKRKELSSSWGVYFHKLEGARKSVDNMERSAHEYRQKVYNTINEIKNEGEKLKSEIDKTVSIMVTEIREKEEEELNKITNIIAGLKTQLKRGNEMEQHVSKALKLKNDTSMLISLQKFQKDMASHIPEVVALCDFSYIRGNSGFTSVQALIGRLFFENEKRGRDTPSEPDDDFKRNVKRYELWACQVCNSERYIDHTEERAYKNPRCCYGFMRQRGNVYK